MNNFDISKTDIHISDDTVGVGELGLTMNYECSAPIEDLCKYFEVSSLKPGEYFEFETTWHADTNDISAVLSVYNPNDEDCPVMTRDFPLSDTDKNFFRSKMEEFCKKQSTETEFEPTSYLQLMHNYWRGCSITL